MKSWLPNMQGEQWSNLYPEELVAWNERKLNQNIPCVTLFALQKPHDPLGDAVQHESATKPR